MRLSDISDTKTLRAGFPDICRAIKEKETDMEVTEKNRTKYRMPGEFEPHEGCVMIWPERPGSWNYGAREAQKAFVKVAEAIGESEKVYMLVSKAQMENAKNQLGNVSGVTLLECETDDAWARDVGATMVLDEKGAVCGVDSYINGWTVCQNDPCFFLQCAQSVVQGVVLHVGHNLPVFLIIGPGRFPELFSQLFHFFYG